MAFDLHLTLSGMCLILLDNNDPERLDILVVDARDSKAHGMDTHTAALSFDAAHYSTVGANRSATFTPGPGGDIVGCIDLVDPGEVLVLQADGQPLDSVVEGGLQPTSTSTSGSSPTSNERDHLKWVFNIEQALPAFSALTRHNAENVLARLPLQVGKVKASRIGFDPSSGKEPVWQVYKESGTAAGAPEQVMADRVLISVGEIPADQLELVSMNTGQDSLFLIPVQRVNPDGTPGRKEINLTLSNLPLRPMPFMAKVHHFRWFYELLPQADQPAPQDRKIPHLTAGGGGVAGSGSLCPLVMTEDP